MEDTVIKKFLKNVEKTDYCWNWIGHTDGTGLPIMRIGTHDAGTYQKYNPRRLSLDIVGKLSPETAHVKPLICRNKLCVNPEHLVQGDEARFWGYVQKISDDECWVWIGAQNKLMYGHFTIHKNGKKISTKAHIYSWELFTKRPVPNGLFVCHKCDHPYCVNPSHLFLGTSQDNIDDKISKNRQARGEKVNTRKLSEQQVREIRLLYKEHYTASELVLLYDVCKTTIHHIVKRKTWKHITDY